MAKLEVKYKEDMAGIRPAKQILREQWEMRDVKERQKDASINYPSYGRGLPHPRRDLETYMVNENLCEDPGQKKR